MTVRRVWQAYGLRPVRFTPFPLRTDPVPARHPWDVIGLYLHPPVASLVVTLRPMSPSLTGMNPPPGGGHGSSPQGIARQDLVIGRTATAFRFLAPATKQGGTLAADRDGLLRFIAELATRCGPDAPIRVLACGVAPAEASVIDRWRVRHPHFEFEFQRDFGAWKERAHRELLSSGHGPPASRQFRERAELSRSLVRSLGAYSEETGTFEWMARRDEIAAREAAYRLRYDIAVTGHPGFISSPSDVPTMTPVTGREGAERASARVVLRQYLGLRPKERLTVESWTGTMEYANAFVLEALRLGARPLLLYQDEPTYWAATTEVPAKGLSSLGEHRRAALEKTDVFVSFFGPSDRERFHSLPTPILNRLCEFQDSMYEAAAKACARTAVMAVGRVSEPSARMYGVDLATWRSEIIEASRVPPTVLRRRGRALAEKLERGHEIEIRHSNGTRLRLGLRGRIPIVADGTVSPASPKKPSSLVTLPAGVVTVAVDEGVAEGTFRSNVRCSTGLSGPVGEFAGGRWTFERGRLQKYAYDEGQELFAQSYAQAPTGRDCPGSLSIGLNDQIATAPLLEDQSLGMVSLLIGRNDNVGGKSHTPWWAWMFLRGATLTVDGDPLVQGGKLVA